MTKKLISHIKYEDCREKRIIILFAPVMIVKQRTTQSTETNYGKSWTS